MSQDPLEEDLSLARTAMKGRPAAIDAQRRARLWTAIDREIQEKEARSFPGLWLLFAGAAAATAAVVATLWTAQPAVNPIVVAETPSAPAEIKEQPQPAAPKTRWRAERAETVAIAGAELHLAEGTELVLVASGVYELVSGSVEVTIQSAAPIEFVVRDARVSALAAKFLISNSGARPTFELLEGNVEKAENFATAPKKELESISARMEKADRERLAGRPERAIALYEKVMRDQDAAEFREEAMLRLAELHAENGRSQKAIEVLAQADARIKRGLLLPERTALAVELLAGAGRFAEAEVLLERTQTIESPALDRARAVLEEKRTELR